MATDLWGQSPRARPAFTLTSCLQSDIQGRGGGGGQLSPQIRGGWLLAHENARIKLKAVMWNLWGKK